MVLNREIKCFNIFDIETKLNQYIKIELFDDTNDYFVGGKLARFENIASDITCDYCFSIDILLEDNSYLSVNLDKLTFNYYFYCQENYDDKSNILYLPLFSKDKYNWFIETFQTFTKQKDIVNSIINFEIKFDNTQSEHLKTRLGNFKLSLVSKAELYKLPNNITFCETINGNPMPEYQSVYDELRFGNKINKPLEDMIGRKKQICDFCENKRDKLIDCNKCEMTLCEDCKYGDDVTPEGIDCCDLNKRYKDIKLDILPHAKFGLAS